MPWVISVVKKLNFFGICLPAFKKMANWILVV